MTLKFIADHNSTDDSDIGINKDITAEVKVIGFEFWHINYVILYFIESQWRLNELKLQQFEAQNVLKCFKYRTNKLKILEIFDYNFSRLYVWTLCD